jgi:DNA-binding LytR/AlgR family response regulator
MLKCIIIDDDPLMRCVLKEMIAKHIQLSLLGDFDNPIEANEFIKKNKADLIFLDLEMPLMSGLEFLEIYKGQIPQIIITTSHDSFAVKAFEFEVSGYLLKPIKTTAFHKAVEKVLKSTATFNAKEPENILFIRKGSTIKKINVIDISFIECIGDYLTVNTENEKFTIHTTMKAIEEKLNSHIFLRVHRSFIINLNKIEEIEDETFSIGSKIIPIGKTYKQTVYNRINLI